MLGVLGREGRDGSGCWGCPHGVPDRVVINNTTTTTPATQTTNTNTTRWHYAKLKHAMDNPETELQVENDLHQWADTQGQTIIQRSTGQDVEAVWPMLSLRTKGQESNGSARAHGK